LDSREGLIRAFLGAAGWGDARRVPLAGDASARRYERLFQQKTQLTAVLMDAPPDLGEDVRPFVRIAGVLRDAGFSAPQILAQDDARGFLLLEDFGDTVFARMIKADPGREASLYAAAVDVLGALHRIVPPQGVVAFTPAVMAEQAGLVYDCYAGTSVGKDGFCAEIETVLAEVLIGDPVLILRDYHAENLIWLDDRQGAARVGLLDFQDAMAGPVGYDLVSLLYDARRDVPGELARAMIARFAAEVGLDLGRFSACCAVLTAQRNLRILGVFARLAHARGKPGYVDLIPRVWAHLMRSLEHPVLADLALRVHADLPVPDAAHLNRLKA